MLKIGAFKSHILKTSHATTPACEKARTPNVVCSCGSHSGVSRRRCPIWFDVDIRRSPRCGRLALDDRTMAVRWVGHLPKKTECTMQHSLNLIRPCTGS